MSVSEAAIDPAALKKISAGNMKFTNDIYQAVSKKDGNVFISPFSVEVVLALAYMGAKGNTANEIASALGLPAEKEVTQAGFRALMEGIQNMDLVTLDVANKVYTMQNYKILEEFNEVADKSFFAGAQELDFSNGEASRKVINSWVEEKTRNKIQNLIPSGLLTSLTRLVLVNALYFKGTWIHKFNEKNTKPDKFYVNGNDFKMVPMMTQKDNFGYLESDELDAKILKMQYRSSQDLSMVVILPNKIDGISELESKLAKTDLSKLVQHMARPEVIVTFPKFKLEETTDFDDILKQVGLVTMYDAKNADFSGISGKNDLFVSKVLQKAFIEVNEEGTEAAAAT
ncbi:hypothetical protein L9F63_004840, partial [Diploptera punctata]